MLSKFTTMGRLIFASAIILALWYAEAFSLATAFGLILLVVLLLLRKPQQTIDPQISAPTPPANDLYEAAKNSQSYTYISHLPTPCLIISADLKLKFANKSARALFSLPERRDISVAYLRNPIIEGTLSEFWNSKQLMRIVTEISGSSVSVWRANFIPCEDGCAMLLLENFTEIATAQKSRSDFLANASHELRTPLTAIVGFIETIRASHQLPKQKQDEYLGIMQRQAARMQSLIEDLLSLSQIETTEFQRPQSITNLVETIKDAVNQIQKNTESDPSITFSTEVETIQVHGDTNELSQIVENLISNAIKYAPGADIKITLGLSESETKARQLSMNNWQNAERCSLSLSSPTTGSHVWVRVEDKGDGIPAAHLPRLGERFYRVDASRSSRTAGTGLGLAIVKHIINRHQGGFGVESELGRGTAFSFWLPCITQTGQTNLPFEIHETSTSN